MTPMANKQKKQVVRRTMMAALTMVCAMVLTSCSSDDNTPATEPIEYGQVFNYTYEGQKLYYIVNEKGEAAVVPPLYPNFDTEHDETWTGYDKPVGAVVIPDYVPFNGSKCPVTTVEFCAFYKCNAITSVTLPSTLKSIDNYAFQDAVNLGPDIVIPEGVTSIGLCAFCYCYNIVSITLPSTMESIGEYALTSCQHLDNLVFPDHLTQLNDFLLMDCQALTNCHLPAQLKTIGKAFFYSTDITSIKIPEHVTSIDTWAFGHCLSLKELTLPASIAELSDSVFCDGTKLDKLTLECAAPPAVTEETFDEDDYATMIIVPMGAGDAYRKHEFWGRFATITEKE